VQLFSVSVTPVCRLSLVDESSYASVLVCNGGLHQTVISIESRIIPCVTAICPKCGSVSLLSDGTAESCVRTVALWKRMAEWLDVL
jgi:hypothetical protein